MDIPENFIVSSKSDAKKQMQDRYEPIAWFVRSRVEAKITEWTGGIIVLMLEGPETQVGELVAEAYRQQGWNATYESKWENGQRKCSLILR